MPTSDSPKVSYKDTLNLPRTDFPIRANPLLEDKIIVERWEKESLYARSFTHNEGHEKFILHDGPPYANGPIHIGHAYNKILKDIVTKSRRMAGYHVPVIPGWDCHGLPIELKVAQEHPADITPQALKKACRAYAYHWITIQKASFKRLGILMEWDKSYLTMNAGYEANIIRVFGTFVRKGFVSRKNKTVPWCISCQTVLASAEIEYQERKDPSIYVLFPLTQVSVAQIFPEYANKEISVLVWTTTPWTLPLNRAVQYKPDTQYALIRSNNTYAVLAVSLVVVVQHMLGHPVEIISQITSDVFANAHAVHPFVPNLVVPLLPDQSVELETGTAFVHVAPGAGPQDYDFGLRNNLDIYSPVSPAGRYTQEINCPELQDMLVTDGQGWIIKKLMEREKLFHKTSIKHSYPHCWRCHNPLIFRATKQWFCELSHNNLREHAQQAIEDIFMRPVSAKNRLQATLEGRLEWCLSRQRIWGIPIPAVVCKQCDYTYITPELIDIVANVIAQKGIEAWDDIAVADLLPPQFACPDCASDDFSKEQDILDVWFDSGVSHYAVLYNNPEQAFPADIYLEGKDQHRGWFQSSLLTALVAEKQAPMHAIITHGFTVDEHGRKMSKSLGNVISPDAMIDQLGTDGLRLWASSSDIVRDAVVSEKLLKNVQEVLRKIRNTCRFLVSNIYDFDNEQDSVSFENMLEIDQYAVQHMLVVARDLHNAYDTYDFTAFFHILGDYCSVHLSALYLDIIKDRLYVELPHGQLRRSAQTACYTILDTITRLMAPILSFTAEQVSDHYQKNKKQSIHLQSFAQHEALAQHVSDKYGLSATMGTNQVIAKIDEIAAYLRTEEQWNQLIQLRDVVLKKIEERRAIGAIKHSLEARVELYIQPESSLTHMLEQIKNRIHMQQQVLEEFLKEFFIVSQVVFHIQPVSDIAVSDIEGVLLRVIHAQGVKCPRCWQYDTTGRADNLCQRCARVLEQLQ